MKFQKLICSLVFASFVFIGCKNEDKKETTTNTKEIVSANTKELAINISGMTCEIGCAKYIQSKLSKEEGVIDANVVFTDSIATVKYDASKTNKASLISLVNGLADNMYTATETKTCSAKKACDKDAKKECCKGEKKACSKDKKSCSTDAKKACCKGEKTCSSADAKKDCCKGEKKACSKDKKTCDADCKKNCSKGETTCSSADKKDCCKGEKKLSSACNVDCKKECCA